MVKESIVTSFRSHSTDSGSLWSTLYIKRRIRQLKDHRILRFISNLDQHLKRKSSIPKIATSPLLLVSVGEAQTGIDDFISDQDVTPNPFSESDSDKEPGKSDGPAPVDKNTETDDGEETQPIGLVYARVSSEKQRDGKSENGVDEGSIQGQVEEMESIADRENILLPYDPIIDEAKSGTNFDRDGIQQVFEMAKREDIDYLLVEKVDRIGRSAAETLFFVYILQSKCEVTLLTSAGERDVSVTHGLLHTTLMSLMAEIQNELRTAKANKERVRGFLRKKNWNCKSSKIPLGYKETEDGWLTVDPAEKHIARDLFQEFSRCGTYAGAERHIDNKYGKDVLEGHKLKTVLQNGVYIGKPRLPEEWVEDTMYENDLEDPDLNILAEDVFYQAQDIIAEIDGRYSDSDTMDLLDFIEEFSLFSVIQGSEPATLLHHCGEPLVKDGQFDLKGKEYKIHRYRCPSCEESEDLKEYYRRWPKEYELDKIELIHQVVDGETSLFENSE